MAINTIKATIQMRRGHEEDFEPDQMTAGEWAVSMDSKKVWMCFMPGLVYRMATYEAFEEDMNEIQLILATCQDIQKAVERFEQLAQEHKNQAEHYSVLSKSWALGGTGIRDGEDTNNSKYYSKESEGYSMLSWSFANGESGVRDGEETDNSKYYSEESKKSSEISKLYLDKVEQAGNDAVDKINDALDMDAPNFLMDLTTGHLMYEGSRFVFNVNSAGHLEWGLTV